MYFPFPVNLNNNPNEAENFKISLMHGKYYYLIEDSILNINPKLKSLDSYHAEKKIYDLSSCDLVLLGHSRNQNIPPHFGVKFIGSMAIVSEYILCFFDDPSIESGIDMLIQYMQVKHANIQELSVPSSINFESNNYKVLNVQSNKIISWK